MPEYSGCLMLMVTGQSALPRKPTGAVRFTTAQAAWHGRRASALENNVNNFKEGIVQLLAEQSTEVVCGVDVAYGYVSNLERFGEWFPGVISIESVNDIQHATVGKRYLETVSIPMRGERKVSITVKEAESNRRFVTEGSLKPLLPRMEVEFRAVSSDKCQITWRMFSRNNGLFARATIVPLARSVMKKRSAIGIERLRLALEG